MQYSKQNWLKNVFDCLHCDVIGVKATILQCFYLCEALAQPLLVHWYTGLSTGIKRRGRHNYRKLIMFQIKFSSVFQSNIYLKIVLLLLQAEYIILDLSAVLYIDPSGALALISLAHEFSQISVRTLLAGTPGEKAKHIFPCLVANFEVIIDLKSLNE